MKLRPPVPLAVLAGRLFVALVGRTCRVRIEHGGEVLASLPRPAILACWHEQLLAAVPFVLRLLDSGRPIAILASHSRDGELTARVAGALGLSVARGSSSRGGRAGLLALYREATRSGASPFVLPDGPRGPRREAKAGVIVLAQMTGAPILPLACAPRRRAVLGSWDRMLLPMPFTVVRVRLGELLSVPRDLDEERRRILVAELGRRLELAGEAARS